MPTPRLQQISLEATPYYHCVSRCVRRAFLCGVDKLSGNSYEHRRDWVEQRLIDCANAFCIDVAAYAIMHNHYHVVLHINQTQACDLTEHEVISRWHQLFAGTTFTTDYLNGKALTKAGHKRITQIAKLWRLRLMDISWFMCCMNEPIARQANSEDLCTGRFWEGRYKSQALLDEAAIIACMAYVDLNPIRAKINQTPEGSEFTSIKQRIDSINDKTAVTQPTFLMPFIGSEYHNQSTGLNFNLDDYLLLVDITGRSIRQDKRGYIDSALPYILNRLKIDPDRWAILATQFEQQFKRAAGSKVSMKLAAVTFNQQWLQGQNKSALLLPD